MGFSYNIGMGITDDNVDVEFQPMRPCTESDFKFMAEDKTKINWEIFQKEFSEYVCVD